MVDRLSCSAGTRKERVQWPQLWLEPVMGLRGKSLDKLLRQYIWQVCQDISTDVLLSRIILRYLQVEHASDGQPQPMEAFSGMLCSLLKQLPAVGQVDCTPEHPHVLCLLLQREPLVTCPSIVVNLCYVPNHIF